MNKTESGNVDSSKPIKWEVGNAARKLTIQHGSPEYLNWYGRSFRVLNSGADELRNFDLDNPFFSKVPLEKMDTWKKVFWNGLKVAITRPIFPSSLTVRLDSGDLGPIGYTTTVFHTETGEKLGVQKENPSQAVDWYNHEILLLNRQRGERVKNLSTWNVSNNSTTMVFSFSDKLPTKVICQNTNVFCEYVSEQPISKFDLESQSAIPLEFRSWGPLGNLGLTESGEVFFSKEKTFVLLSERSQDITKIALSFIPTNIIAKQHTIACSKDTEFYIYDLRKGDKHLFHHDYRSFQDRFEILRTFSITHLLADAFDYNANWKQTITCMTFGNKNDLYIGKGDGFIDYYDLNASFIDAWNPFKSIPEKKYDEDK